MSRFPDYGSTSQDGEVIFSGEIRQLIDSISTNIYTINKFISNLQDAVNVLGTSREGQGLRDQISVWQLSSNEVVKVTTENISRITVLARGANKPQKLQIQKITTTFQKAAQDLGKVQQLKAEIRNKKVIVKDWARSVNHWKKLSKTGEIPLFLSDENKFVDITAAEKIRRSLPKVQQNAESDETSLLEDEERQQKQLQLTLQFENDMLAENEMRVKQIESNILNVNAMMKELATSINEQGVEVETLASNIESCAVNVISANEELQTASNYQTRSRKRNICLFGFLFVVLIILIGIIIGVSR